MNKENKITTITIKNPYHGNGLEYKEEIGLPPDEGIEIKMVDGIRCIGIPKEVLKRRLEQRRKNFKVYDMRDLKEDEEVVIDLDFNTVYRRR